MLLVHVLASAYVSARTVIDHWGEENRNGNKQYWFYIWGSISSKTDFFQAEDGIRDIGVTGVQTCALPIFVLLFISPKSVFKAHME